jgi:enediyne biosynthesis protein E4
LFTLQKGDLARAGSLFLILGWFAPAGNSAESGWHELPSARWRDLGTARPGRAGFVQVEPARTGVEFTNRLDAAIGAANRVLENGSGVALGDYDQDGRIDIFLCSLEGKNALYRNLGDWRFQNVTAQAGLDFTNFVCRGAVFADVNGDSRLDLLISTLDRGVLCLLNNGSGGFTNATALAGTASTFGSMSLALADVDGDGTLDLYVANYRTSDIRDRAGIEIRRVNGRVEFPPDLRDRLLLAKEGLMELGDPDILYLNDGAGQFHQAPWNTGRFLDEEGKPLTAAPRDWGLTATFRDLNGDGAPDLYVCNDYWTPDRFWTNTGKGIFRAASRNALRHTSENSMGVDVADLDRDGKMDFLVLDMLSRSEVLRRRQLAAQTRLAQPLPIGGLSNRPQIMRNTLFHNRGDGTFEELADFAGLPASDWSWQPAFVDVDLDGFEDLIISAGHRLDVQDLDATAKLMGLQHPWPKEMDPRIRQEAFNRELLEHSRYYPPLAMPVITFRNRGDLTFEETTANWGTEALGVHQGIAFADLDGDGDLDFVVNNLNGPAMLYRNESPAPRLAVRLKGLPPNTQGTGALITVRGGAQPLQSQEVVCGGRYLSGDDPLRVFAAGSLTNEMRIEITWRDGNRSTVTGVTGNRLYEISEAEAVPIPRPAEPQPSPWFVDVSSSLQHIHHEDEFNDFERQPLLPRKLSQLGPGVAWIDVDGDGLEDLVIGGAKGGTLTICRNLGGGRFNPTVPSPTPLSQDQTAVLSWPGTQGRSEILAGLANYENGSTNSPAVTLVDAGGKTTTDWIPGWTSSPGPLALGDLYGNGTLALFVGGRVIPSNYPFPATSRIYTNDAGTSKMALELKEIGLVSGAVWSDLNGDGFPELILACEWGPLRIFQNHQGQLNEINPRVRLAVAARGRRETLSLNELKGWWNGVTTADLDGDGRPDIIASNWGKNTKYEPYRSQPLRIFAADYNQDGTTQILEAFFAPQLKKYVPWRRLDEVASALPWVRGTMVDHAHFSIASVEEILGDRFKTAQVFETTTLESMVLLNRGDHFEAHQLPFEAQLTPAFGICAGDLDGDGNEDIVLSQNFFDCDPGTPRLDAGRGLWLRGDGTGKLKAVPAQESGIAVYGEQRGCALCDYDNDGRLDLVISQNGAETKLFHNVTAKAGLRVRLLGPAGNPLGFGAQLRLVADGYLGPVRELHGGSGYWSQDSAVQVLCAKVPPASVWIRWPGGKTRTVPIPPGASEMTIPFN